MDLELKHPQSTLSEDEKTNSFGVYLHIPYCVHRCSYCDFFSSTQFKDGEDFSLLFKALQHEFAAAMAFLEKTGWLPVSLRSVFLGGGTPSLAPPGLISAILAEIRNQFAGSPEITLEANPETVTIEKAEAWIGGGVNRVSMGAQSFQPDLLAALERRATPEAIRRAVGILRSVGFEAYSLDLIFGIPGQGKARMLDDLNQAIELQPGHISFYNLTLKPAHALYPHLPSDDESADLFSAGVDYLAKQGFSQYEISNFSRPGAESQHNLLYWDGGDFLGIGPSAASRFFRDGVFHHRKQISDLKRYFINPGFPDPGFEVTTKQQTILEAVFLELRKNRGVSLRKFAARYGYDLSQASKLKQFSDQGLVVRSDDCLKLTARGLLLADSVTSALVD